MNFLLQDLKKDFIHDLSTCYSISEANAIANQVFEHISEHKPPFFDAIYLDEKQYIQYTHIKNRLFKGEPLQYVLERAYFFDLNFYVNKHVLIPRPETEEMTEWLINYIQRTDIRIQKVLDIGTGSGCIAITLKKKLPHIHVHAWDISPDALEVAEYNAQKHHVNVQFTQQDLFRSDLDTAFAEYDCVISNPPYIPWNEKQHLDKNIVDYEPHLALFVPDSNPLLFYEAIAIRAKNTQKPIITEVHQNYAYVVQALYQNMGLNSVQLHKDLSQNYRWITCGLVI